MARNPRENFILSGFICISFGAFFSIGGIYSMGATVGVCGLILFIIGMSMKSNIGMSKEAIEDWTPSGEILPDAGRVMYRVDVTLDEPIRSTFVCGPCGNVDIQEGSRPQSYTCPKCSILLWESEEE